LLLRASAVSARGRDPLQVEERKSQQGRGWRGRGWTPGETEFWEEAREREREAPGEERGPPLLWGGGTVSLAPSRHASRRDVVCFPRTFSSALFSVPLGSAERRARGVAQEEAEALRQTETRKASGFLGGGRRGRKQNSPSTNLTETSRPSPSGLARSYSFIPPFFDLIHCVLSFQGGKESAESELKARGDAMIGRFLLRREQRRTALERRESKKNKIEENQSPLRSLLFRFFKSPILLSPNKSCLRHQGESSLS
jgi:hypothetical protein